MNIERRPLIEEVATSLTAPQAFELLEGRPFSFFLDSGMNLQGLGRYSFMGSDPFLILASRGTEIDLIRNGQRERVNGNPFDVLGEMLDRYALPPSPIPFIGGAVGYLGYDLGHFIERLPSTTVDDLMLPDCCMAFYDGVIAFDHVEGKAYVAAIDLPDEGRAQGRVAELRAILSQPPRCGKSPHPDGGLETGGAELKPNFTREGYLDAVAAAREHIAAGDIFQVNLSQRFDVELPLPPYELYRRLRSINPAPFACYLDFDDVVVAGASPERFLRLDGDMVETRPMKGTRPRGGSADEDEALARELITSAKDRAENVMIVDLERNDLGRVCEYGTVNVRELYTLERYATVFQLTSTVEGRLGSGRGRIDLLKAAFPGGSITGAPKVRAMEIIDELEPTRRGVYTGSVGYMGFDGAMDLNIVIRTFVIKDGRAYFQVGGGIVHDSVPEAEYQETLDKARALIQALECSTSEEDC